MAPQRILTAAVSVFMAMTYVHADESPALASGAAGPERLSAVLAALGPEHTQELLLERGVLASIARELHSSYARIECLELRVRVLAGMRLLSPEESPTDRGMTIEELEQFRAPLKQEGVVQWQMSNRSQFRLRVWLRAGEVADGSEPDWEMVSCYEAGPVAVEAARGKVTEKYALASFWEGRQPRLFPIHHYHCGEFAMFPFSLVGAHASDNSPRTQWNLVFFRGKYDGVHPGADEKPYHRLSWVQTNDDGSVNRVHRLYVNPSTWRVAQIDEFGPAFGPGNRIMAVLSLSWQFTEVSTDTIEPSEFDPEAFRDKVQKEQK